MGTYVTVGALEIKEASPGLGSGPLAFDGV